MDNADDGEEVLFLVVFLLHFLHVVIPLIFQLIGRETTSQSCRRADLQPKLHLYKDFEENTFLP